MLSGLIRRQLAARRSLSSYTPADPKTLNWGTLGFAYVPTQSMIVSEFSDGKWSAPQSQAEPYLRIHALSNVSQYP